MYVHDLIIFFWATYLSDFFIFLMYNISFVFYFLKQFKNRDVKNAF